MLFEPHKIYQDQVSQTPRRRSHGMWWPNFFLSQHLQSRAPELPPISPRVFTLHSECSTSSGWLRVSRSCPTLQKGKPLSLLHSCYCGSLQKGLSCSWKYDLSTLDDVHQDGLSSRRAWPPWSMTLEGHGNKVCDGTDARADLFQRWCPGDVAFELLVFTSLSCLPHLSPSALHWALPSILEASISSPATC